MWAAGKEPARREKLTVVGEKSLKGPGPGRGAHTEVHLALALTIG